MDDVMINVAAFEELADQNYFYHSIINTWKIKIRNASQDQLFDWVDELTPLSLKIKTGKFDPPNFKLVLTRLLSEQSGNTLEAARLMVLLAIVEKLMRELQGQVT